jgi:hypothetical protein
MFSFTAARPLSLPVTTGRVVIGLFCLLAGCGLGQPRPTLLENVEDRANTWLTSAGAHLVEGSTASSTQWSRQIHWTVEADRFWTDFSRELRDDLPRSFDRCDFGRRSINCSQRLSGDVVLLVISLELSGRPSRASITLTGRAD